MVFFASMIANVANISGITNFLLVLTLLTSITIIASKGISAVIAALITICVARPILDLLKPASERF